ncbi:MAG: YifB family Mg chelatase-like AAA ATPase [Actinobacteria bacterium]|nr:YifB family Mg chelatase-like AAA ATPase [Actinomycetota bacterium]
MFFKLSSFALIAVEAIEVYVEVHISAGLPSLTIVGLPDKAVNESRQRVRAAIKNSGFIFPLKKIIINLSPADIRKEGAIYDLPIAVAILAASEQVDLKTVEVIENSSFIGELSLDGQLRPVKGIISMAEESLKTGRKYFFMPAGNIAQACLVKKSGNAGCISLREVLSKAADEKIITRQSRDIESLKSCSNKKNESDYLLDFSEVKGQLKAKRAVEIAAAGMHHIMMVGPPGTGKSMIAQRLVTIMPDLTTSESLEVTKIYCLTREFDGILIKKRPFRNPHHTISRVSLTGGGISPKPGEISLAHRGVLFLDEFNQFPKNLIEDLRQPLENKNIIISRNNLHYKFPCSFMLIIAANPCNCGYNGDKKRTCRCSTAEISRYWNSISGPIMDRIDMKVEVPSLDDRDIISTAEAETSSIIRQRVINCHKIQAKRYKNFSFMYNSEAGIKYINSWISAETEIKNLLLKIIQKYKLSGRAVSGLLKITRTIADLENCNNIKTSHLLEALNYRTGQIAGY